ncbi:MAG: tRNA guanosine(34) transglycosylase Tgt [Alphaproteobacteria bacterium]|nr:tRNA guanosine(34) transglycosylase Tgt [Alphaproteobacteria bacterium]
MSEFSFELLASDGAARTGVIHTPRGDIRTPAFMPVGTAATVKAMMPQSVRETGADILLGNTYHLMLRPGAERVARLGGLHKFMDWQRPILTDSGGFQVMSLSALRKINEEGVKFQSHIDGHAEFLSPERAMEIQRLLGSDIQMVFDECPALPATHETIEKSMALSMRWAKRSKTAFGEQPGHACFGIVQGGTFTDLRQRSAEALREIGFDGYAVGGLAVGEPQEAMFETLDGTVPHLPTNRPRYLMGVGKPSDIVGAVLRGIDMFDCVLPTRSGRNGQAFTWGGALNLKNARFAEDPAPLEADCRCPACRQFSRAYLHHTVKSGEIIAAMLLTWHNLTFYQDLMQGLRQAIAESRLSAWIARFSAAGKEAGTA